MATGAALFAITTVEIGVHRDSAPDSDASFARRGLPKRHDFTRELVTRDHRIARQRVIPGEDMEISPTDATGANAHDDLIRLGRWVRHRANANVAGALK